MTTANRLAKGKCSHEPSASRENSHVTILALVGKAISHIIISIRRPVHNMGHAKKTRMCNA